MKRKLAEGIVKARFFLMALVLLLTVPAALSIGKTRINYDLNRYLSDSTMTKRALKVMEQEFSSGEQLRVMFSDRTAEELAEYTAELNAMPEVLLASHQPETGVVQENGTNWQLVTVALNDCDGAQTVQKIRSMFPQAGTYYVGGTAASQLDVQHRVGEEIPLVMIIAVVVVLAMLLLTSHAWAEPAVLLVVLGTAIVLNMGTNFVFPDVSFITFAVSAILQLALSIDYAIMLLHTFNGFRDAGMTATEAMTEALRECFMRIASSALTTVAGLLSLLFMSFTIGFDIGMVLSKGILISMLCVFLLMPGLTLLMEKPLQATRHRPVRLGGERLAGWIVKARRPLAVVLALAVIGGFYLNSRVTYSFSGPDVTGMSETKAINDRFRASSPIVILMPGGEEDEDYDRQRQLAEKLKEIRRADGTPAVKGISAMVTTGAEALKQYTPEDVAALAGIDVNTVRVFFSLMGFGESVRADKILAAAASLAAGNEKVEELQKQLATAREAFIGPNYARMLADPAFSTGDGDFRDCMKAVLDACGEVYGDQVYITGTHMSNYDISNAFRGDLLRVNLITLLAILLIVTVSFRALRLPVLLVFVIEGAIWINMGVSVLTGSTIFFISYLICLSIQMGATIDYGILLSDQYRAQRRSGKTAGEALSEAMKKALPTVLTSGIILIVAGFIIGKCCSIYYISSIGLLVSRGALVSVALVLLLLPPLLLSDRISGVIPSRRRSSRKAE
ncbi:MAG: MMPL family transporter [Clostridia bacterium]|nr:MMPL family transporter [Clostridia bacterium]